MSENSTLYLSTACQNLVLRIVRKNLHNGSDHFGFLTVQFVIGTPPSTGATWKRSSVGSSPVMTRTESTHAVASTSPLRRSGMASQIFVWLRVSFLCWFCSSFFVLIFSPYFWFFCFFITVLWCLNYPSNFMDIIFLFPNLYLYIVYCILFTSIPFSYHRSIVLYLFLFYIVIAVSVLPPSVIYSNSSLFYIISKPFAFYFIIFCLQK